MRESIHANEIQAILVVTSFISAMLLADVRSVRAEGQVIEEILVTARKRTESMQDVPVVIQAFTSRDIERYASSNLEELSELATGVIINPGATGNGGSVVIRGIGPPTLDPGIEGSVTVNIDGVQVDRGHVVRQSFFDMESVQVLKGPQALFYGKNSPGGVLALQAAKPSYTEFEARLKVGYEFEADEVIGEAVVSSPLADNLAVRLAYRGSAMDGYLKNNAQPITRPAGTFGLEPYDFPGGDGSRIGGDEGHALRLTLAWQPYNNVEAVLRVLGTNYRTDNLSRSEVVSCSGNRPITTDLISGMTLEDPFGDCRVNGEASVGSLTPVVAAGWPHLKGSGEPGGEYDSVLASLNLEAEFEKFSITAVTGYYYYDYYRIDNFDATVFNALPAMQLEDQTTFSQEVRIHTTLDGAVNFMAGVFFETFERDSDALIKLLPLGPEPITGFTNNFEGQSTVDADTYSVFGQMTWDISENVELAGGLRWTKDDREAEQGNVYANPAVEGTVVRAVAAGPLFSKFDDTNVSSELTMTWRPSHDLTLFAAYREGYKSGSFSTTTVISPIVTGDSLTVEPEEADGFEVGFKSMLLNGRLRVNGAVYAYDFDNLQVSAFDAATTSISIINAASSITEGVEVDVEWLASEAITVRAQANYNKGEFDQFAGAPCWLGQTAAEGCIGGTQDLSGHRRPHAPEWSGSIGVDYHRALLQSGWNLELSTDAIFTDEYSTQTSDNPFFQQGSHWKVNARVSLISNDGRWDVSLIGRNLANERVVAGTADKPFGIRGDVFGQIIRPKQLMLQTSYNF